MIHDEDSGKTGCCLSCEALARENSDLRRKLAEQQAMFHVNMLRAWPEKSHDEIQVAIKSKGASDELDSMLSAAKQEGYEQGYAKGAAVSVEAEMIAEQRWRDEVMRELSAQEPVAWKFEEAVPPYCTEKGTCTTASNKRLLSFAPPDLTDQNIHHVVPLYAHPDNAKE